VPGKIEGMDGLVILALICGLVLGAVIAAAACAQIGRARREASDAQADAELARLRSATAEARSELSDTRTELAEVHRAYGDQLSELQQKLTRTNAAEATAVSQRDHALDRLKELTDDRDTVVNQFQLLSAQALERQAKTADDNADRRLKATEMLMAPVRESLDLFNSRLTEVEKERVAIAAELRSQVTSVQQTGEVLRRYKKVLVCELNGGQLRLLLRANYLVDAVGLCKVQGKPFLVSEVEQKVEEMLRG